MWLAKKFRDTHWLRNSVPFLAAGISGGAPPRPLAEQQMKSNSQKR
jgi:hypothetical protein